MKPTITVTTLLGDKQLTRDEFVKQWVDHVHQVNALMDWDDNDSVATVQRMLDDTKALAEKRFDQLLEKQAAH